MFTRPTTFVIGAGASCEIDFPVGDTLTEILENNLRFPADKRASLNKAQSQLFDIFDYSSIGKVRALKAAARISSGMSQALSIDNFLHAHYSDPDVVAVGKMAITHAILHAEAASGLNSVRDGSDHVDLSKANKKWYKLLWQMMHEGVLKDNVADVFSNVSIVTFNYDRSLEYFLFHSLKVYFGVDDATASCITKTLKIVHPYGQVGRLPWQADDEANEYGRSIAFQNVENISKQIRTFTEQIDGDEITLQMLQMIQSSQIIIFLGFAFGRLNLKLMQQQPSMSKLILGTSFKVSEPNTSVIKSRLQSMFPRLPPLDHTIVLSNETCTQFLANYREPIMGD